MVLFMHPKVIIICPKVMSAGNKFRSLRTHPKPVILLRTSVIERFQMAATNMMMIVTMMIAGFYDWLGCCQQGCRRAMSR